MKSLPDYLGCGQYGLAPSGYNHGEYIVSKFSDIYEKIIPLLNEYPLLSVKKQNFLDFVQIAEIIRSKNHLTEEGLKKIILIKNNMKKRRIELK